MSCFNSPLSVSSGETSRLCPEGGTFVLNYPQSKPYCDLTYYYNQGSISTTVYQGFPPTYINLGGYPLALSIEKGICKAQSK